MSSGTIRSVHIPTVLCCHGNRRRTGEDGCSINLRRQDEVTPAIGHARVRSDNTITAIAVSSCCSDVCLLCVLVPRRMLAQNLIVPYASVHALFASYPAMTFDIEFSNFEYLPLRLLPGDVVCSVCIHELYLAQGSAVTRGGTNSHHFSRP